MTAARAVSRGLEAVDGIFTRLTLLVPERQRGGVSTHSPTQGAPTLTWNLGVIFSNDLCATEIKPQGTSGRYVKVAQALPPLRRFLEESTSTLNPQNMWMCRSPIPTRLDTTLDTLSCRSVLLGPLAQHCQPAGTRNRLPRWASPREDVWTQARPCKCRHTRP